MSPKSTVGRNDPCPCGSGEKYKRCCLSKGGARKSRRLMVVKILAAVSIVAGIVVAVVFGTESGAIVGFGGLLALGVYMAFSEPPDSTSGGNPGAINFGGR